MKKRPVDYFKMFYADTSINGSPAAIRCGIDFYGTGKVLFGTDFPLFTPERWLADLEKTEIRDSVKPDIMLHNAARLFGHPPSGARVDVLQIDDGLWRWTALHPDWKVGDDWEQEVGCVYYEAPDATVLLDPLVPRPSNPSATNSSSKKTTSGSN